MSDLILRVRRYIGDQATPQHFADQDIQDQCDEHRFTVRYAALRPGPTLQPGALYNYTDYYSDVGQWESDAFLSWNDFSTLTPATSDYINGHWTFSLPAPGQYPNVYVTGKYYDLHAVAAELLEQWAASIAMSTYNFSTDGQTFSRGSIITTMLDLAAQHRALQMAVTGRTARSDIVPENPPISISLGGVGYVDGT
jgi:hypothetical protein